MIDLRDDVRAALVRVIADAAQWPPADSTRFHNQLLDECGDAARPLVALIVAVMDRGITGRLPAFCATRGEWERVRGALVISLATEAFIQSDMAAWAVDSWAVALGAIDPELLLPPRAPSAPRTTAVPTSATRGGAVSRAPSVSTSTLGAAAAARRTAWSGVQRSPMPPNHWTQRWPMDRILGIGLIVFFTVTYGGEYLAIRSHRGADAFVAPTATSPMVAALPIAPAQAGGAPEAAAQNTAAVATPAALDTIKLADGRVLVGRIQLRDGAELGFTVAPSVAGRYAVTRELLSSGGDASCEQAAAVIRAALPSEETILHVPGSSEFTMSSRPGVRGHLDRDGRFDTPLMSGEKDGIHYSFRMSGRFTVGGFRAESESTTESVVRYRESQSCRFVAALTGTRLP